MRIVGGKWCGRRISELKNSKVRPTTDFAKEGLFNILNHRLDWTETVALDLFSGTGSISFEMLSRGCKKVYAVENSANAVRFIKQNIEKLGGEDDLVVVEKDVFRFLNQSQEIKFNFIFADPFFSTDSKDYNLLLDEIFNTECLAENGVIVLEHSGEKDFQDHKRWQETRKYGGIRFSFFA